MELLIGLLLPFLGTMLGAASVFFVKNEFHTGTQKFMLGFASGVMVAASVWSLLIPSMELSASSGKFAFIPAAVGFLAGIAFLLLMDRLIPHLHMGSSQAEGPCCKLRKTTMLVLAVTIHNIPEGMAVGVVFAGMLSGNAQITVAGAFALSVGIAIQNLPEGAIISLPLKTQDQLKKSKAFTYGLFSGIVEPVAAAVTVLLSSSISPFLPYLLSFAAGAMIYVVVEELIPEASEGQHSNIGTISFALGFVLMMILDVALG